MNDPGKFHRIYLAAKEGKIQAIRLDLTSTNQLISQVSVLQNQRIKISVLDLSSAWMPRHITNSGVTTILENLKPVLDFNSVLLLTKGDTS